MFSGRRPDWFTQLELDGFAVVGALLESAAITKLISSIERAIHRGTGEAELKAVHALRQLHQTVPDIRQLADSDRVRSLVETVLGPSAILVRSLFFDKTTDANWKVAWHQDLTIAVRERSETPGFGPWSIKDGVPHVQPPVPILNRMFTVRIHLDDCGEDNGPLRVLPRSHRFGRLDAGAVQRWRRGHPATSCCVSAGGVVLMRPLLLHASTTSSRPAHRRVIHLEFAAEALPGGLQWMA
jgi:ectoine hydroxylase-related dioxygenase (phytanoyl-CoA dioxygenase family)